MTTEEIIQKVRKHAEAAVREKLDQCRKKIERALGEVYADEAIARTGRAFCSTQSPEGRKLWAYFERNTNNDLPDFLVAAEFERRLRGLARDLEDDERTQSTNGTKENES